MVVMEGLEMFRRNMEAGARNQAMREDFAVMWRRILMRLICLILTLMETSTPPGRQWPQCAGVLTWLVCCCNQSKCFKYCACNDKIAGCQAACLYLDILLQIILRILLPHEELPGKLSVPGLLTAHPNSGVILSRAWHSIQINPILKLSVADCYLKAGRPQGIERSMQLLIKF